MHTHPLQSVSVSLSLSPTAHPPTPLLFQLLAPSHYSSLGSNIPNSESNPLTQAPSKSLCFTLASFVHFLGLLVIWHYLVYVFIFLCLVCLS